MIAKIEGTVLKSYEVKTKDREGKEVMMPRIDLYDGNELVKVNKTPSVDHFAKGDYITLQVKIYANQYGLSVVYDSEL
nr:unnamed protein product [uncultured bacterium]